MKPGVQEAVEVLREVISLVQRPGTDVAYSRYDNVEAAVADLTAHLDRVMNGDTSKLGDLDLLFAPTGSIQDISIDSGWGDRYLVLAERLDRAIQNMLRP